ncbi:MAG TPA: ABC transporter permease subunit [Candidatus Dormibacteraeota bacterium]|nr:ABC transporter permease subunit [Candidatus Dormibacteraeota bacterium]
MILRTIAFNTFGTFLRDKVLIVVAILFTCGLLLMLTPLLGARMMETRGNIAQAQSMVLEVVSVIVFFTSGFGSLLAAWTAADSVATEMKSGTILAVMARPVKRWQFLLGKFLGVMLLMCTYVAMMLVLSYLLALIGGQKIHSAPWAMVLYPLVRYSIYAALAMALVTLMHPMVAWGITAAVAVVVMIVEPTGQPVKNVAWRWIKNVLYIVLPSSGLLSEDRFLTIKDATIKRTGWLDHVTTLSYGLDYALVLLLIAMWSFHSKSLRRD